MIAQLEELTLLVADLVDLAREEEPVAEREALRLDELVARGRGARRAARAGRALRDRPGAGAWSTACAAGSTARSSNLLDNAAKYGGARTVEVTLRGGELTVRDHGPGIADEDLPFVFDRFYRARVGARPARLGARARDRAPGGRGARRQRARGPRAGRRRGAAHGALTNLLGSLSRLSGGSGSMERDPL